MFKRYVTVLAAALALAFFGLTLRVWLEQRDLAARLIRLHVVGASDEAGDQARKLRVRDALLPEISALTAGCADAEAAADAIDRALPELAALAARTLGTGEPATATLAPETFPRRDYDSFSLPAGTYQALRITLGAGRGHNWWCVAFPALCLPTAQPDRETAAFDEAAVRAGLSEGEVELMTADTRTVRFKFRLLDWLAELFD